MYMCVYICIYVHIYVYIRVYICVYTHTHIPPTQEPCHPLPIFGLFRRPLTPDRPRRFQLCCVSTIPLCGSVTTLSVPITPQADIPDSS